jgi:predicted nucleic acid-binding protein
MKYLIFDAGPIISMAMNGLLPVLEKLSENFDGEFVITPSVRKEVVGRPMKIKKYKLEAIKVDNLIDRGILKMSTEIVVNSRLDKETKRISKICNGVLRSSETKEKINIIHEGEASCIAFASLCGCNNVIVVDERTTRLLIEAPKRLNELMHNKLHIPIISELSVLSPLKKFKVIRSTELMFIAYKKNLFQLKKEKNTLDAILYSLKFKGTAISAQEIEEMKGFV